MANRPTTVEEAVTELALIRERQPKVWAVMLQSDFVHYFKHTSFTDEQKSEILTTIEPESKRELEPAELPDPPKEPPSEPTE
jgi:hypothetical protein